MPLSQPYSLIPDRPTYPFIPKLRLLKTKCPKLKNSPELKRISFPHIPFSIHNNIPNNITFFFRQLFTHFHVCVLMQMSLYKQKLYVFFLVYKFSNCNLCEKSSHLRERARKYVLARFNITVLFFIQ